MSQSGQRPRTTLQAEFVGDVTVIRIVGSMTEEDLSENLRSQAHVAAESGQVNWILDVSKVETMDACGLGEMLTALTILSDKGGTLAVAQPSAGFLRFFDLHPLLGSVRMFPSVEEAIEAIRKGSASFVPNLD